MQRIMHRQGQTGSYLRLSSSGFGKVALTARGTGNSKWGPPLVQCKKYFRLHSRERFSQNVQNEANNLTKTYRRKHRLVCPQCDQILRRLTLICPRCDRRTLLGMALIVTSVILGCVVLLYALDLI